MRVPLNELLYAISRSLDFVEQELLGITSNHGKRTGYLSGEICRAMGMSEGDIFDMAGCAMLHDNALTAYMLEAGPGDIARLENFKSHCEVGEKNAQAFPWVSDTTGVILYHHENWDGTGFHNLCGEDIPLRAIILRMADNMDLNLRMGDGRDSLKQEIIAHARRFSGTLYAPAAVEALCGIVNDKLIECLKDENIEASLRNAVPSVQVNLSTEQMLKICGLFASIVDAKSPYTKKHSTGIAEKTAKLAHFYKLEQEIKNKLVIAAYMHDMGKLGTPRNILEKPGPLTKEESRAMQLHAAMSEELLRAVDGLEDITAWCAYHHEKLNGTGYPHGCTAPEISFESRLIACCDIYQALTEDRPYRNGMTHAQSMEILNNMVAAGELDGDIVSDIDRVFG